MYFVVFVIWNIIFSNYVMSMTIKINRNEDFKIFRIDNNVELSFAVKNSSVE